ncbi:D-isomer specific 2-hydroxyacid dehydrogenase [Macleaya cordata]|uniref:D-isomer specific 2-hydroxyacid dehydrogenase n=1 Tax=Macleaya cordata TaxID=56857 RepID=A0A200PZW2_MACCD|nr:D-isomer specific 2-hydroxyacid dehydrogenase [Macleaya cordata]
MLLRVFLVGPQRFGGSHLAKIASRFFLSTGYSGKVEKMVENTNSNITRVLFCGPYFPASHNYTREYLQKYPFVQVDDVPLDDVPDVIANYHICVVKNRRLNSEIIARATQMKLIMQFGVGLEGVDVDAATRCGIKVARIPGNVTGNSASCAEMAIYLMLGLLRKQKEMEIVVKQKRLGEPPGETLLGKTVFIMGFGNIGIDLAKRLRPFGVKILATKRSWPLNMQDSCRPNGSPALNIDSDGIDGLVDKKGGPKDLYNFAREADIVVPCLLLNSETAGIVNKKFLSSMKKGALLVNIARGGVLDYEAVASHLESGHLGGLGIDVAWTEPFNPDDPILKFQNVLITPHVAGVTEYSYRTMAQVVGDTALQLHAGKPLTGVEYVN